MKSKIISSFRLLGSGHEHKKNNLKMVSKKMLYGIFTLLLYCHISWGQSLMSDEDHRIMMYDYAVNLNSVLTANLPQGITIGQFKKKIVKGELTLSSTAQASIIAYALPLKTYGGNFATAKGLTANTDAYKYFFSSFAPNTLIQNGKLVESITTPGLAATEMWSCALESFNTDDCGTSALVSDKNNLNTLANANVSKVTVVPAVGNMGVLVILNGFSDCILDTELDNIAFEISESQNFISLLDRLVILEDITIDIDMTQELSEDPERILNATEMTELSISLGFHSTEEFESFRMSILQELEILNNDYFTDNNQFSRNLGINLSQDLQSQKIIINSSIRYYNNSNRAQRTPCEKAWLESVRVCTADYVLGGFFGVGSIAAGLEAGGANPVISGVMIMGFALSSYYVCFGRAGDSLRKCRGY